MQNTHFEYKGRKMKERFKVRIIIRGDMYQAIAESNKRTIDGPLRFTKAGAKSAIARLIAPYRG